MSRDVFAMHRRQLERATEDARREQAPRRARGAAAGGRMRHHVCNRGGRLNGWPICWFCYVEARLGEVGHG